MLFRSRSVHAAHEALDAIGGIREVLVQRHAGSGLVQADVGITMPSAFNFASGAFARGSVVVTWYGPVSDLALAGDTESQIPRRFGLRTDLTSVGASNAVSFRAYSDVGVDVTLTFYRTSGQFVTAIVKVPPGYNPDEDPVLQDFYVPFSDFIATGELSPYDVFQDTRAITMLVAGRAGADAVIANFGTTQLPEPAYGGAVGLLIILGVNLWKGATAA